MAAMGQHAGPHTVFVGINSAYALNCPRAGVTMLPDKDATHCPSCGQRIVSLEKIIPTRQAEAEYNIHEETY